jgi:curved DNA-binding protein
MFKDYYHILGVPRTTTEAEIKRAYRKLAHKHHPDLNPQDKTAETTFKEINEAYTVLSDPENSQRYDHVGANWQAGADFTLPPSREHVRVKFGDHGDLFGVGRGQDGFSDFLRPFSAAFAALGPARASPCTDSTSRRTSPFALKTFCTAQHGP